MTAGNARQVTTAEDRSRQRKTAQDSGRPLKTAEAPQLIFLESMDTSGVAFTSNMSEHQATRSSRVSSPSVLHASCFAICFVITCFATR